ncbi:ATP-dependent DNA ligase [Robbsia andropogonis]|uniref:ATP-dependent DNA ligase n=1 Tax=Robbsia andropogonis TaxID=28092 RepID=UPI002A698E45|nr:ATP-dependent DNA ligase [Robbsia andropogonis]
MIPQGFKAMLAAPLTKPEALQFPVSASPKIDGVRAVIFDGVAYAGRSMKPIPNNAVQQWARLHRYVLEGLDGELVVGSPTAPNCMQATTSGVMRIKGEPDFSFHVFDCLRAPETPFETRYRASFDACEGVDSVPFSRLFLVDQWHVYSQAALDRLEGEFVGQGYEGMMVRSLLAPYKYGRSTEREAGLLKVKRFTDAEAVIVGFVEEMHNTNEATKDNNGRTERSTAKAGLVGKGTLGAFIVRDLMTGLVFNVGTGFTAEQRAEFWLDREALQGRIITYKSFQHGVKELPRHPVFKSFRALEDMQQ